MKSLLKLGVVLLVFGVILSIFGVAVMRGHAVKPASVVSVVKSETNGTAASSTASASAVTPASAPTKP